MKEYTTLLNAKKASDWVDIKGGDGKSESEDAPVEGEEEDGRASIADRRRRRRRMGGD
jgi:hypothetical protein